MEQPLLEALTRIVDPVLGLIRGLHELPVHSGEPPLFVVLAEFQNPYRLPPFGQTIPTALRRKNYYASGAGFSRSVALQSAIGEALERYCAQTWAPERIVVAKGKELGTKAFDVRRMIHYSSSQYQDPRFAFRPYDPDCSYSWIDGWELRESSPVFIPAALAIMGFGAVNGGCDKELGSCNSSGMAAGSSFEQASASALLELIERDAFMVHWYTRNSPPRISTSALKEALPKSAAYAVRALGDGLSFLDITTDLGVPCALALCPHPKGFGLAMGASCRMSFPAAAEKALLEASQCMLWVLDAERSAVQPREEPDIRDFTDHVRFYLNPANHGLASFLTQGDTSVNWSAQLQASVEPRDTLNLILDVLDRKRLKAYVIDMTPDDVRDLGIVCVRAIIPGLQPLYCGYGNQHLDPRRVSEFAARKGVARFEWNLSPHPFP